MFDQHLQAEVIKITEPEGPVDDTSDSAIDSCLELEHVSVIAKTYAVFLAKQPDRYLVPAYCLSSKAQNVGLVNNRKSKEQETDHCISAIWDRGVLCYNVLGKMP